jgi:hypothetical protein
LIVQIPNDSTPLIDKDMVVLEAVMTKKQYRIDWHTLLDEAVWQQGW